MADLIPEAQMRSAPNPGARRLDISILIVTWNSERWVARCLRALPAACDGLEYEVILHDNASDDATVAIASRAELAPERFQIVRSTENSGFAGGTNRGIERARGEYFFLLNPDCELAPGALTRLCTFLDEHPAIAGAAPLLIDERGDSQRHFQLRRLPSLSSFLSELFLLGKLFPRNAATLRHRYTELDLSKPQKIEQPAAAALLLRRSAVEQIGRLDEQFSPAWFEDVDYCQRLARASQEIWVVPSAEARHYGGASLEKLEFAQFADIWYRNMWRYARKWMRPWKAEVLRWGIVGGMLLRVVAALFGFTAQRAGRRDTLAACRVVIRKALRRWSGD